MLTSVTSVIERRQPIAADHTTHPFEVAWAREAVFFIQTEDTSVDLHVRAEISPDGINWVDHGAALTLPGEETIAALTVQHFAGWLRLHLAGATAEQPATILVHLHLKA